MTIIVVLKYHPKLEEVFQTNPKNNKVHLTFLSHVINALFVASRTGVNLI